MASKLVVDCFIARDRRCSDQHLHAIIGCYDQTIVGHQNDAVFNIVGAVERHAPDIGALSDECVVRPDWGNHMGLQHDIIDPSLIDLLGHVPLK